MEKCLEKIKMRQSSFSSLMRSKSESESLGRLDAKRPKIFPSLKRLRILEEDVLKLKNG